MLIAHKDEFGNEQQLIDHILNVGKGCYRLGLDVDVKYMALLVGILHDVGKSDPYFQDMINGKIKSKVNHSSAGAKYILNMHRKLCKKSEIYKEVGFISYVEILMYVIESHHGVFDIIDFKKDFPNSVYARTIYDNANLNYTYQNVDDFVKVVEDELTLEYKYTLQDIFLFGYEEYVMILQKLGITDSNYNDNQFHFYNYCLIRLLLSILKNEDILDSINAYDAIIDKSDDVTSKEVVNNFYNLIELEYKSYPEPTTDLNKVRKDLSDQIRARCDHDSPGIYRLDLPTGAGKTKLSLLYSLHQMRNNNKKRMIYIAPFLSILEQNAHEIKKTLINEEYILEHHSNVISIKDEYNEADDIDTIEAMKEYLKDTWDQIIVLSSMVQFTNTLFKAKSSNIRRFYNLSNSVIILDEVQSLPTSVTHVFNLMMNFISKVMNSNIILCSATQPSLNHHTLNYKLHYGGRMGEDANLVNLTTVQQKSFDRTIVNIINDGMSSEIKDLFQNIIDKKRTSILIILNTKSAVEHLYNRLNEYYKSSEDLYYLTTNMCPRHRLDIIEEIRNKLNYGIPVILVSTSLIEAGVDLDFSTLYRSFSGIDSIVQAMGRCNREGKLSAGVVNLINLIEKEENLDMLPSIKERKRITEELLKNNSEFDLKSLNSSYYSKLYSNSNDLDYKLDNGDTMLDLLSKNDSARSTVGNVGINMQSIKEATSKFNLLKDESISVIVYYKESFEIIEQLIEAIKEFDSFRGDKDKIIVIKQLIRDLQPYTINLYSIKDLNDKLVKIDGLDFFDIRILNESNYNEDVGLTKESELESFIL